MYQKFFTDTIVSDFIKNKLSNTPLPVIDTVKDGDIVINNCNYIYNNSIIKCNKSGQLNPKLIDTDIIGQSISWNQLLGKVTGYTVSVYNSSN